MRALSETHFFRRLQFVSNDIFSQITDIDLWTEEIFTVVAKIGSQTRGIEIQRFRPSLWLKKFSKIIAKTESF
jgi:hypothetical protein